MAFGVRISDRTESVGSLFAFVSPPVVVVAHRKSTLPSRGLCASSPVYFVSVYILSLNVVSFVARTPNTAAADDATSSGSTLPPR